MRNGAVLVDINDLADVVNWIAYEDYAQLARSFERAGLKRRPSFADFLDVLSKRYDTDVLPISAWQAGYDLIYDLFEDNEQQGQPCDAEAKFQHNVDQLLVLFNRR